VPEWRAWFADPGNSAPSSLEWNDVPSFRPRGLLAVILRGVRVRLDDDLVPFALVQGLRVELAVRVPDRDHGDWVNINFSSVFAPLPRHLETGLSPKESALIQAIRSMWEHELEEGVLINGAAVLDPDKLH
jgi:hypothetical protein